MPTPQSLLLIPYCCRQRSQPPEVFSGLYLSSVVSATRACKVPVFAYMVFSEPADVTSGFRWSAGSALFLASWAVLMGPMQYAQHLVSGNRLPFTVAYFGSIALTMYFAIGVSLNFYHRIHAVPSSAVYARSKNDLSVCASKYISFAKT
jgi:hypothetical protein